MKCIQLKYFKAYIHPYSRVFNSKMSVLLIIFEKIYPRWSRTVESSSNSAGSWWHDEVVHVRPPGSTSQEDDETVDHRAAASTCLPWGVPYLDPGNWTGDVSVYRYLLHYRLRRRRVRSSLDNYYSWPGYRVWSNRHAISGWCNFQLYLTSHS